MEKRELTCIGCPMGCRITVILESGQITEVNGYTCKRGEAYARQEVTAHMRSVTTTVRLSEGDGPVVPVKTAGEIPKEKIFDCVLALKSVTVKAPVHIGEKILTEVAGTGIDIIATKSVGRKPEVSM